MTDHEPHIDSEKKKSFSIVRMLLGSFLVDTKSFKQLPFVLFLAILAIISIACSHCADRKVIEIAQKNTELRKVRSAYITTKRELMRKSKQSVVEEQAGEMGIYFSQEPPTILEID
ncbi:MAG: hypothetical protein ACI8ZO_000007 [Flavobacteriales bacterium]|jgi:hypothetical protein